MNIIILGAGRLGAYVASILSKEEHNVTLIDQNQKVLDRIAGEIDVATIAGDASNWKLFEQLFENRPDFFIALTGSDEANLTACAMAKNLGYPKTICRIKELSYLDRSAIDFGRLFYVDHFISAEVLAANEILKTLLNPGDLFTENFAHGAIQMRTINITEKWDKSHIPLSKLDFPEELIICLIIRKGAEDIPFAEDQVIFPHGSDTIMPGDQVTVVGSAAVMHNLHEVFPLPQKKLSSLTIAGGTQTAEHLIHLLSKIGVHVKIIEKDENRCEKLAGLFPSAIVINHDSTDLSFLMSEKVQDAEAFIACLHHDDENLLISSLAKEIGCEKVIALISDMDLSSILGKLDIAFAVSEKVNITNRLISIIHAQNIVSITSIANDHAKVVEIKVSPDSQLIGIPLADLSSYLPKDLLIAVIENKGRVMVGKGNRILSPNDTIILITSPKRIHELQQLF